MAQDPRAPTAPVVQEVELARDLQPGDSGVVWADDFEAEAMLGSRYQDVGSNGGRFAVRTGAGVGIGSTTGLQRGISQRYDSGQVSAGWAWRFFGDHPQVRGVQLREVWARFYHRFDTGFAGIPPKMARMGVFGWDDWTLAAMVHYWWGTRGASRGHALADVASNIGLGDDQPIERGYNKLSRWLPVAISDFRGDTVPNIGRWICYEMRVKLNDPNVANGEYDLWADGRKIVSVTGRNLVGGYGARGINAFQLDTYWNEGSPRAQERFYDNLVIATRPIGLARSPRNPKVFLTPFVGAPETTLDRMELEIATAEDTSVVFRSHRLRMLSPQGGLIVGTTAGTFVGTSSGRAALEGNRRYIVRARVESNESVWSDWSAWHAPFLTVDEATSSSAPVAEAALRAWPNPASDRLFVESDEATVELRDALGRIVRATRSNGGRSLLDLSGVPAGVYHVTAGALSERIVVVRWQEL